MLLPRVSGRDDDADGFLIEPLETSVPLEIFEMTSDCAFRKEFLELFPGNKTRGEETLSSRAPHGPSFPFGESLAEKIKIGKRLHGIDAAIFQLLPQPREVEARLEMVHAGFEKTFPMQTDPESHGAKLRGWRKPCSRKVELGFLRHQIHIRKHYNSRLRLLGDLRAPTRFAAGIITLALLEPELFEKLHDIHKMLARASKRMMIMIAPTETEPVLP